MSIESRLRAAERALAELRVELGDDVEKEVAFRETVDHLWSVQVRTGARSSVPTTGHVGRVIDVHMPCPYDTDGDTDCGRPGCLYCGGGERFTGALDMISCPSCGQQTLMATDRGRVLCRNSACEHQGALQQLLAPGDQLTVGQHRVTLTKIGHWTAVHPVVERIGDGLLRCGIEGTARNMIDRGFKPGEYLVQYTGHGDYEATEIPA